MHRQIGKLQEQLAEAFNKQFEIPLQRNMQTHSKRVEEGIKTTEKSTRRMEEEITKTEGKMSKGRKKDLAQFQTELQNMQRQAQELEAIKNEANERMLADEQNNLMFLVQKAAGIVKNEYEHYSALSICTRDATEDIISIAFAPPGKILDAAERRHVVDKFLGTQAARDSVHSESSTATAIPIAAAMSKPRQASVTGSQQRPATPPTTPLPEVNSSSSSSSTGGRPPAVSIHDELKRLNIAATNVAAASAVSPSTTRTMSFTSQRSMHSQGATVVSNSASEDAASSGSISSALAAIQQSRASMSTTARPAQTPAQTANPDLVKAIHDFTARTERELSFGRNDILLVRQRQENWIYASHYPVQPQGRSGWIPVSYTATHEQHE